MNIDTFRRDIPNHFSLPRRINRLGQLANNIWWVWHPDAQMLFNMIDKPLWDRLHHNPIAFLYRVDRAKLNAVTDHIHYLEAYDKVMSDFDVYMKETDTWYNRTYPATKDQQIGYFSFEFGLHESLPVYAGGLGILSGDHLKESSDLGLPMVAVGFVYTMGYFSQRITEDGWQEIRNTVPNLKETPILPLVDEQGKPLTISVELPGRNVIARIWTIQVGRIPLFLLDTNVEQNSPMDQQLTSRLYSNDPEVRISQEVLLGMGGVRALRMLGYNPVVWHMNEGHSAFLTVERILELVKTGKTFDEAAAIVRKGNVFTTHTPVPAGNDQFPLWLVDKFFAGIWPQLNLTRDQFIDLGRTAQAWGDSFVMPVLALKLSDNANAVSQLHGEVSRKMWQWLWPDKAVDDVPIRYITNGVHTGTWLARRLRMLYEKYLGADWLQRWDDPKLWEKLDDIPDAEIWALRKHLKRKLINYANERARDAWLSGTVHPVQVVAGGVMLEPYSLTIGFARRFATYKRGALILRDYERILRIINNADRPVQIVFAGKAHPADEPGKMLIQQVYRAVKDSRSGGRLVFLEDYDMYMARLMVQGVDVWLNTPRRPNEASGTSGMKAALNGTINFSVMDGWFREGYNGENAWMIGEDKDYADPDQQDDADMASLYDKLENEIIPLYYQRSADGLPSEWIARIKETIRSLGPQFSTRRMLKEYVSMMYQPAILNQVEPEKKKGK